MKQSVALGLVLTLGMTIVVHSREPLGQAALTPSGTDPGSRSPLLSSGGARRPVRDSQGRIILDGEGRRISYPPPPLGDRREIAPRPQAAQPPAGVEAADLAATSPLRLEWYEASFSQAFALIASDIDGDGNTELVVAETSPNLWRVLSRSSNGYATRFASDPSPSAFDSLAVTQMDADPQLEILIAGGGTILVVDGATYAVERRIGIPFGTARDVAVDDLDADGVAEIIVCVKDPYNSKATAMVLDQASGNVEFSREFSSGAYLFGMAVGNGDADAALEIVLTNGEVIDGATHVTEWTNPLGFGDLVRMGDVDGDGRSEAVCLFDWDAVRVFDIEKKSLAASFHEDGDMDEIRLMDVDEDGQLDVLVGDGQWGNITAYRGGLYSELWHIANSGHGVHGIAVGDSDGDGRREIVWSTEDGLDESTLFVAEPAGGVEWRNGFLARPRYGLASGDLDADGAPELVTTVSSSGSYSSYGGTWIAYDAATYAPEYTHPLVTFGDAFDRVVLANLDGDSQLEVVVTSGGSFDGRVTCYDGLTRLQQWQTALSDGLVPRGLAVADVDGDGELEVVASSGRKIQVLGGTGLLEWETPTLPNSVEVFRLVRIANVDGDAQPEIIASALGSSTWGTRPLVVFDAVEHTVQTGTDINVGAMDAADTTDDGQPDIVIANLTGTILRVAPDGSILETLASLGQPVDALRIADLDGSGTPELIVAIQNELRVYSLHGDLRWRSGALYYPSYSASPAFVGAYDSLLVADIDDDGRTEIVVNVGHGLRVFEASGSFGPLLSVGDVAVTEGSDSAIRFTIALSAPATTPVAAVFTTIPGTASPGSDYVATSGTVYFPEGATSRTLDVPLLNDAIAEPSETLTLTLESATGASCDRCTATAGITDDDPPGISVADVVVLEPIAGGANYASFTVSLSPASASTVTVQYATADGSATAPEDYEAISGTVTFPPGSESQAVVVRIAADTVADPGETFSLRLSNSIGANLVRAAAEGRINEQTPTGSFHTVIPCRLVDSREIGGPLAGSTSRSISVVDRCGVPADARAVSVNLTTTAPTADGYLTLYSHSWARPATSSMNFSRGQTRAANAVVGLGTNGLEVYSGQALGSSLHFILDVNGYFD